MLTALLYTSLATMFAVSLVASQQLDIRRTTNVVEGDRAYVFAMGVETWVKQVLLRDEPAKDSLDEDWALVLPPIPVEGGQVSGQIIDMQSRFNLNNLVNEEGVRSEEDVNRFQALLNELGISPDLAIAVVDWVDKDNEPNFPAGAEDDEYLSYEQPYRTANRLLASPSELLLVKGFTMELYQALEPHVTVLPERTPINVNTASAQLLASLHEELTFADAQSIVEQREEAGFDSVQAFKQLPVVQELPIQDEAISVNSNYFMLDASAQFGSRGKVRMFSLMSRKDSKIGVVMRAEGVY